MLSFSQMPERSVPDLRPGAVVEVVSLAVSAQPISANDAYFYDGAAAQKSLHDGYHNPTSPWRCPFRARRFSAGIPAVSGGAVGRHVVSGHFVISAMALHLVLFAGHAAVVYAI